MSDVVEKMQDVAAAIEAARGPFTFFALFEKQEIARWDVLVAAPWIDADRSKAIRYLADQVNKHLKTDELIQLGAIVMLENSHRELIDFTTRRLKPQYKVLQADGSVELAGGNVFGVDVARIIVFRAAPATKREAKPVKIAG